MYFMFVLFCFSKFFFHTTPYVGFSVPLLFSFDLEIGLQRQERFTFSSTTPLWSSEVVAQDRDPGL